MRDGERDDEISNLDAKAKGEGTAAELSMHGTIAGSSE